jgi:hypothetical protein
VKISDSITVNFWEKGLNPTYTPAFCDIVIESARLHRIRIMQTPDHYTPRQTIAMALVVLLLTALATMATPLQAQTQQPEIPACYMDADGDGYGDAHTPVDCSTPGAVADSTDCVDENSAVHPGAIELCDGLDNDCDTIIPDDETDNDGDGFSTCDGDCDDANPLLNPADADTDGFSTCDGDCDDTNPLLNPVDADTDGFSTCGGDCDDTDPSNYSGNTEVCDGGDNDCDTFVDDDDDSLAGGTRWCADNDSDTLGDPATAVLACGQPQGYVADCTDCDDGQDGIGGVCTTTFTDGFESDP